MLQKEVQKSTLAISWKYDASLQEFKSLEKRELKENALVSIRLGIHDPNRIIFNHKNHLVITGYCEQVKTSNGFDLNFTYNNRSYKIFWTGNSLLATCEIVPPQTSGYANGYES